MKKSEPLISIITATYNRSNVLAYAIKSVLKSTYQNWEHLIIGDACTDDTERVVNSFRDKRIRFFNLPDNIGEQSGPNNAGFRLSAGEYITYLNHDDLWFPDHLEKALQAIIKSEADLVSNLVCAINEDDEAYLIGMPQAEKSEPFYWTPASAWMLKRDLIEDVGPWRFYRECYASPSQEWLFRAWKAGKKLLINPELTVIALQSGRRKQAYRSLEYRINEHYFQKLEEAQCFRERILINFALATAAQVRNPRVFGVLGRLIKNLIIKTIFKLGRNPYAFWHLVRYGRKGGFIDNLRKNRGLNKLKT